MRRISMSYHYGKFNWFEHLSSQPATAAAFLQALFGWKFKSADSGGHAHQLIHNGDAAIGALREAAPGTRCHWNGFVSVADVDVSMRGALACGARAVLPPADLAEGRAATLADPTGALVSLCHGVAGDRPDLDKVAVGDWYWNELMTSDAKLALAFYEKAFGYSHELMQSPAGDYYILKSAEGKARAGVMRSAHPHAPSTWLPYVRVEDADAIAARIGPLGGKLMMAPFTVAGVGRLGALFDPLGAALGFIHPAVMA
jgi:predicted enzyme related to lactoylglutathione lyase